ncbi:MAG: hypothetical protein FD153_537 [Rhodospirillaceae bacterium]|nr:MAG: hypothetical protein FD153_537 [Rhodospirillaceae bacterium]
MRFTSHARRKSDPMLPAPAMPERMPARAIVEGIYSFYQAISLGSGEGGCSLPHRNLYHRLIALQCR